MDKPSPTSVPQRVAAGGPIGRNAAMVAALVVPFAAAGLLSLLRGILENTSAALILVLVIVGAACTGHRAAGIVAAASAGIGFDFFLTAPYRTLSVSDRADVETLVVLVLLGVAANEIIQWGRRGQRQLLDRDSYLETLLSISGSGSVTEDALVTLRDLVAERVKVMLDLDSCSWVGRLDETAPQLDRDGEVRDHGRRLRLEGDGWPTGSTVMLPARPGDPASAGFALTAATHVARPTLRQRQLAGALADQLGGIPIRLTRPLSLSKGRSDGASTRRPLNVSKGKSNGRLDQTFP